MGLMLLGLGVGFCIGVAITAAVYTLKIDHINQKHEEELNKWKN